MPYDDPSPGNLRRSLIAISLGLLAAQFTRAVVAGTTIFGVQVSPPVHLPLAYYLWPFWLYFLIRYWQFFTFGKIDHDYSTRINDLVDSAIVRAVTETFGDNFKAGESVAVHTREFDYKPGKFGWTVLRSVATRISSRRLIDGTYRQGHIAERSFPLPKRHLSHLRFRARWYAIVRRPPFTETILPFAIAALPAIYAALSWFNVFDLPPVAMKATSGGPN